MATYDFGGQVAFVTGAAHGQGRSHAVKYAENGADVVVTDICETVETSVYEMGTEEELEETASMVEDEGQEALTIRMDVRDEPQVQAAVEEAVDHFGHVDILANNAGIFNSAELTEMPEQQWDEMIDTNLKGVWLCMKHVGKHFVERGGPGKVVSTSSTAGLIGAEASGHYAATKWGVRGLTKTFALEMAEYDVNVNCVCPTGVDTPMIEGYVEHYGEEMLEELAAMTGPFNVFEPEDGMIQPVNISEAYMWLSSDAARYVTGIELPVDAGFTAK